MADRQVCYQRNIQAPQVRRRANAGSEQYGRRAIGPRRQNDLAGGDMLSAYKPHPGRAPVLHGDGVDHGFTANSEVWPRPHAIRQIGHASVEALAHTVIHGIRTDAKRLVGVEVVRSVEPCLLR
ncbi:hypothetical protein D3C73_1179500 [compost metagenome]